jgi:surface protein
MSKIFLKSPLKNKYEANGKLLKTPKKVGVVKKVSDNRMIYLHENGITILAKPGAKGAKAGETYELNGKKYYVAINKQDLKRLVDEDTDMTKVVTSKITTMNNLFSYSKFNRDISNWDTSNVKSMSEMFYQNEDFNQAIGHWNTKNVTAMISMFHGASSFNQPIGNWDTIRLNNITSMFEDAKSFNQSIENWVGFGTSIKGPIKSHNCMIIRNAFKGAESFNQSLKNWKIKTYNPYNLFENAKSFNGDLSGWKLYESLTNLFKGAESFNKPLNTWDVSDVIGMKSLFKGAKSFNQDLSKWNMSNVYQFENMFYGASSFNQDIGNWNVSNVYTMQNMFREASNFNQDISSWDTSNVEKMTGLFQDAISFNQDIRDWKLNKSLKYSNTIFKNAQSFNEEFNPYVKIEKPKKASYSKKLSPEDKKTISKIKKLLIARDFDKIDLGIELLVSLNNIELFETLLHDYKIDSKAYFWEMLKRNKIFSGSKLAQPYLDYAFLNVIANTPKEAKIHKSLVLKNIHYLSTDMFLSRVRHWKDPLLPRFYSFSKFNSLKSLKIDFSDFSEFSLINISFETIMPKNLTELKVLGVQGSLEWMKYLEKLKSLSFSDEQRDIYRNIKAISHRESFNYLKNLETLEFTSKSFENLDFLSECSKLKKISLTIIGGGYKLKNIDFLVKLKELDVLELTFNEKDNDEYVYFDTSNLKILKSCHSLKKITINGLSVETSNKPLLDKLFLTKWK